jgi:hypothetical protein
MNVKFFRAYHGEGKTKWLFERALDARNEGCQLLYVGDKKTMQGIVGIWEAEMHEKCPIELASYDNILFGNKYCILTDGLTQNMSSVGFCYAVVNDKDGIWYITMDKEDFID